jgi:ABC-type transport system involved in multi-copper enzyme maturation permease subunit
MLKLIRLEMGKNNAAKYALYEVIAIVALTVLCMTVMFLLGFGDPKMAKGTVGASFFVEMMTSIVFLIFAAVMHSEFTINAYKNKTMDLMFSYPIKRGKIVASKIIAVLVFNLISIIIAQVIIFGCIYIASRYLRPLIPIDFDILDITFYGSVVIQSVMTICISLIALFVGMIKKSSVATIVSSFFLVALLKGNLGELTLAGSIVLPVVLTVISIVFAFLMISGVERKDVL